MVVEIFLIPLNSKISTLTASQCFLLYDCYVVKIVKNNLYFDSAKFEFRNDQMYKRYSIPFSINKISILVNKIVILLQEPNSWHLFGFCNNINIY